MSLNDLYTVKWVTEKKEVTKLADRVRYLSDQYIKNVKGNSLENRENKFSFEQVLKVCWIDQGALKTLFEALLYGFLLQDPNSFWSFKLGRKSNRIYRSREKKNSFQ